ncbi:hypothetical protein KUTeg_000311 [Tegillarca granosa]|uniref:Kazal-like domain-containing protein n=1 Tax=Tegillarca granosa TaxID=220873 RepID=A0ABQ9G1K6_TEGGR|nr:hypothetical protein KUTeg_000311 [Tegillarca granosa]
MDQIKLEKKRHMYENSCTIVGSSDLNSTSSCIPDCSCDVNEFFPLCGSDGKNYYSPCYAGCPSTTQKNQAFSNCTCIPDGMATSGLCDSDCPNLYPWAVVNFFSFFTDALTWMPTITSWIRSVEDRDKSTAIGLQSIIGTLLCKYWHTFLTLTYIGKHFAEYPFMPAPIAFGKVIDTTCLIWKSSCGSQGSCQFYDIVDMRIKLHALTVGMKFVGALALMYVTWKVWNVESWEQFQEKRKSKEKTEKELEGLS